MEGNDISSTIHKHVACWFEGLIITRVEEHEKRRFFRREKELPEEEWIKAEVRKWRANEMPIKSLYHMVNQLDLGVEVYTYFDDDLVPAIEHYLARKGIAVSVYSYDDLADLRDDFRLNRDVHTLFTPYEDDAAFLGMRATVTLPDGTFGI